MKFLKSISLLCALLLIFFLNACLQKNNNPPNSSIKKIATSHSSKNISANESRKVQENKSYSSKESLKNKKDPDVKILLYKYSQNEHTKSIKLECSKGLMIRDKSNFGKPLLILDKLEIRKIKNLIQLTNCNTYKILKGKEFYIHPLDNNFILNGTPYQGILNLVIDNKKNLYIINKIKLNDYLYSVLRYEIIQSWDMEMQKVQAVASRTYALYHILKAKRLNRIFDLKNTNHHQTYNGTHEYTHLRKAIDDTNNLIITHNNKPALTMFDSCCGGIIPAHIETDIFISAPYLARNIACNFCKNCFTYNWKFQLTSKDLLKKLSDNHHLKENIKNLGNIRNIKVIRKDKAGIVQELQIHGDKRSLPLAVKKIQSALKPKLRSCTFVVKDGPKQGLTKTFSFEGRGFGHHLGLCQHGARELVKRGWGYKKILSFYYPDTMFDKLEKFL